MKIPTFTWCPMVACLLLASLPLAVRGNSIQAISAASVTPASGGGGDSLAPVISADGRYVLFASSANNLVVNNAGNPVPVVFPAKLNVFLRDQTNGTTVLVSANLAGTGGGNGDSLPVDISTNGQYVLFESQASNLIGGDTNGVNDIFLRDLVHGTTQLVSGAANGLCANGASRSSTMTPDGRYVAFVSAATNLVAKDTNGIADVFVRDMQSGTTTLASVGAAALSFTSSSELPDITPDGRYVAFYSTATNLVPGITNSGEIYVRDLAGLNTIQASAYAHTPGAGFHGTNIIAYNHSISDDGQYVAYEAGAATYTLPYGVILRYSLVTRLTDVVTSTAAGVPVGSELNYHSLEMTPDGRFIAFVANANGTTSGVNSCIELWDGQNATTTLVSGNLSNTVPTGAICDWPVMDTSGRYVAFLSSDTSLVTNSVTAGFHLYLRDMQAGSTQLVDADTNGMGSLTKLMTYPRMSTNGSLVAFESYDGSLVPNDNNHAYDVFVNNATNGTIALSSARLAGLPSTTPNQSSTFSPTSVSTDARYVAFYSEADDLTPNDANGYRDVFVHDAQSGTNLLVSVNTFGILSGNGISTDASISGDGRYVAFTSSATNLVAGDTNGAQDVFVRDLQAGATVLASINTASNGPGNAASYSPTLGSDGRYVLFHSKASTLAAGISSVTDENIFWRDLQTGVTRALTTNNVTGGIVAAMSPNGRYVVLALAPPSANLYVWDTQLFKRIYTNSPGTVLAAGISPNGDRVGYVTTTTPQVHAVDVAANTNLTLATAPTTSHVGLQFSGDSRYLAYAAKDVNGTNQVYLFDYQLTNSLLISHNTNSAAGLGNGNSDSPAISPDGRFVAYRSAANNLVPNDNNGTTDVYLYDQMTGMTTLVSASLLGNMSAGARSLNPVFSGDSQTLLFQSWSSDLAGQDFNQREDIFAAGLYSSNTPPSLVVGFASAGNAGQAPVITWPLIPGKSYQVQFKNNLGDTNWQTLGSEVTAVGAQGYANDPSPAANQRFYRILMNP